MFRYCFGRSLTLVSLFCLAPHCFSEDACRQATPKEMAKAVGVELPSRPWHVANIWWDFEGEVKDFESLEIDITIDRDVPDTYNLYVSPCGIAKINGLQFYGGIQTNVNGWPDKKSRTRVHPGKGGIFSRWSADLKTPIGLDHVRVAAPECLVESAGYEGEFASVRRPFTWTKGTYTWGITKGETIEQDGRPETWFTCWVIGQNKNERTEIGSLRFEGESFTFWARHSAFVEVYATSKIPRSGIPKVNVSFSTPRLNGKVPNLKKVSAYYPDAKAGGAGSPDCANVVAEGDQAVVQVGPIFRREEARRRHDLQLN